MHEHLFNNPGLESLLDLLFYQWYHAVSLGGITKILSVEVNPVVILSRCHSNFPVIPLTIDTSVKQLNT
jgi:hypothetical protein